MGASASSQKTFSILAITNLRGWRRSDWDYRSKDEKPGARGAVKHRETQRDTCSCEYGQSSCHQETDLGESQRHCVSLMRETLGQVATGLQLHRLMSCMA